MKKSIFAILAGVVCLVMVACSSKGNEIDGLDPQTLDNTVEKCWEIIYTYSGQSASSYIWATEKECVEVLQESQKMVGVGKYTYKASSAKDANACYELDEKSRN